MRDGSSGASKGMTHTLNPVHTNLRSLQPMESDQVGGVTLRSLSIEADTEAEVRRSQPPGSQGRFGKREKV